MLKLSYSRLQVAKTCDLKYYLQYDQKVKSPRKRSGALIVGSAVHDGLQDWYNANYPSGELMPMSLRHFDSEMKKIKSFYSDRSSMRNKVARASAVTEELYRKINAPEHGIVEYRVEVPMDDNISLLGIIDLYMPNEKTVYDLKVTSEGSSYKPDTDQLLMYALILKRAGQPVERAGFVFPLRNEKFQYIAITDELVNDYEKQVLEDAEKILKRPFRGLGSPPPLQNRGNWCRLCDYRETTYCPDDLEERFGKPIRRPYRNKKGPRRK